MNNFEKWRNELLLVGNIIQDADESITSEESERRFNRYIEMLESLDGTEGKIYAVAVFESVQAIDDYGAYQTANRAAWQFGEQVYCESLLQELPRLIKIIPDWAGDFLVSIANGEETEHESVIRTFNKLLVSSPKEVREVILQYISAEENDGWFEHRVGVLGKNA